MKTTCSILGVGLILSCTSVGQASLIFSDSFNYAAGGNLGGQGGWVNDNSGNEVGVVSGNLSVSGLAAPSGNMVSLGGSGMDPYQAYTSRSATTYYSVAFTITSLGSLNTSGGYVLGLASGASFAGAMWLKSDGAGGFYIGIGKRTASADVAWSSSSYSINSTIFVAGDYVFNAGSSDDVANLWINPDSSTFAAGTAPSATLTTTTTGTDSSGLTRFYFRQDSTTATPSTINFDEVRVGTTWADVTPIPEPAESAAIAVVGLLGICTLREWRQHCCREKLKS